MKTPTISLIAAIGKKRELGKNNALLWHIPEDMRYFREKTKGHPVIMGRKTFESIGRTLPNRTNIVLSRSAMNLTYKKGDIVVSHSLADAVSEAKKGSVREIFVIGGEQIYRQFLPIADRLYLTVVDAVFSADSFFPEYENFFKEIQRRDSSDENYRYSFRVFERTA